MNRLHTIAVVLALFVLKVPATSAQEESAGSARISLQVRYDSNACPVAAQVYLEVVGDTLSGFEIALMWDRPDIVGFDLQTSLVPDLTGDTNSGPRETISAPKINWDNSLLRNWQYVEARGDSGHWVKVTGLASLVEQVDSALILPGGERLLFELPLVIGPAKGPVAPGDSVGLHIQTTISRLSNVHGSLLKDFEVQDVALPFPDPICRGASPAK